MDPREIVDVFCGEKYKRTETAKSGVLTSDRQDTIVSFLENSAVEGESKLRFLIKKRKYLIVNKKLCQERIVHGVTTYLEVPTVDELYDLIKGVHEDCGHEGIITTYKAIQLRYAYVPREVVGKFISLCLTCQLKRSQQKIKTIKPIVSEKPLQRCQNCDEASCELALDTLEKIHWDAVREAAHLILGLLPALPTHPPTSIDGTQLGAFGDGTTFSERIIPKMYVSCKAEVKNQLANADQVALTTDGWTSCANDSYITVTSSHINDQWELVNFVLQTRILNESHTADNLADVIKEPVQEWGISCHNGFPPVTTDNVANVTKSVKLKFLGKIRRIAAFFHRSPTANELLKQKALLLSLPSHDLIIDVVTRWNSAFDMMARFLEMQCAVITVLISKEMPKGKDLSALTEEEMRITEDIIQLLKPMKDMTTMLCTEDSPTLSVIMPLMPHMKLSLSAKDDDVPAVREMKAIMLADLQDRYNDQRETLLVASAVDPRFKHLPFLSDAERYDVYKNLTLKTSEVMESRVHRVKSEPNTEENAAPALPELNLPEIESQAVVSDAPHDDDVSPSTADCVHDVKPTTLLEGILGDVFLVKYEPAKSPFEMSKLEIESYVSHSGITLKESCLQWWKRNEETFPNLSKLAKKLLCIPATSVPSERAFSTAGDIVTHQRASLKAKNVDMLLFLKKNLKD